VHLFRDGKADGLRELAIVSRIVGPKSAAGPDLHRGTYSTTIYNILDGEVHLYAEQRAVDDASSRAGFR